MTDAETLGWLLALSLILNVLLAVVWRRTQARRSRSDTPGPTQPFATDPWATARLPVPDSSVPGRTTTPTWPFVPALPASTTHGPVGAQPPAPSEPDARPLRPEHHEPEHHQPEPAEPVGSSEPTEIITFSIISEPSPQHFAPVLGSLPLDPHAVPDSAVDGADLGALRVRAASVHGDRRRSPARSRGDSFLLHPLRQFDRPSLASVIASGPVSGGGSSVLTAHACRSLATSLDGFSKALAGLRERQDEATTEVLTALLRDAAQTLAAKVRATGAERDGAVEITCLVSPYGDFVDRSHLVFGVGTGRLLRLRDGTWDTLFDAGDAGRPHRPAFMPDRPQDVTWRRIETNETKPGDALVLCTGHCVDLFTGRNNEALTTAWSQGAPRLPAVMGHFDQAVPLGGADRTAVSLWEHERRG
jgi:hypothetical protein